MTKDIASVLHEHADGDVHVERLLDAVYHRARVRRRRRIAVSCAAAVLGLAAVGTVLAGALSDRRGSGIDHIVPATSAPAGASTFPRPPRVAGVPASASPAVLGSNVSLFHLDLTGTAGWTSLSWDSRRGHEELHVTLESGVQAQIEADRDRDGLRLYDGAYRPTTVAGRRAEVAIDDGSVGVRWQPAPGIWAQVNTRSGLEAALDLATRLRLDRVYRCALPFRLADSGTLKVVKCTTYVNREPATAERHNGGGVWLSSGDGAEYFVATGAPRALSVTGTIGGRPVEIAAPLEIRYAYPGGVGYFYGFGPADAVVLQSLVTGFTAVAETEPNAWPSHPFR